MSKNQAQPLLLIPAYNAARHLPELIKRTTAVFPAEHILIIDDGSSDNTQEVLSNCGVACLKNPQNLGKGATLQRGYNWARGKGYLAVVTIDADLQHAPEELAGVLAEHQRDPSAVIIGSRFLDHSGMPLERLLSNNLTSIIVSIFSGSRVRDSQSGFRLVPLAALAKFNTRSVGYMYESETLLKMGVCGAPFREAPISVIYEDSISYINPLKDTWRFVKLIWRRLWF